MEIFYLKKDEFLKNIDKESLKNFSDGRSYLSTDKHVEHLLGLFLVKFSAKHIYGLQNTDIIFHGKKPVFKSGKINFSISHSNNIVLAAFNNAPIGVDTEFMKERDFKKLLKRYKQPVEGAKLEDFYRFWTTGEAKFKLNNEVKSTFSAIIEENYMCACASSDIMVTNFRVKKLIITNEQIPADLTGEFDTPKRIKIV